MCWLVSDKRLAGIEEEQLHRTIRLTWTGSVKRRQLFRAGKESMSLFSAIEDIKISKFLATTLEPTAPVELKMEDLKLEEPDNAKLDEIFPVSH